MRPVLSVLVGLLLVTAACGSRDQGVVIEAPATQSEPPAHELLGVGEGSELGRLDHASTAERYRDLWRVFGLQGAPPDIDFAKRIVLFVLRAEDACPDLVDGVVVTGGAVSIAWRPPPGGCNEPLIPTSFAIAVHRDVLPLAFDLVEPGFAEEYDELRHHVELEPYDGPPPGEPGAPPPARTPTANLGSAPLPSPGETRLARLDDGLPVWVVHHRDGTVDVLAIDHPSPDAPVPSMVLWRPGPRTFSGGYDEWGRSLHGPSHPPLARHEVEVAEGEVRIGRRVPGVTGGVPQQPEEAADDPQVSEEMEDLHAQAIAVGEARALPEGTVAVVAADVVTYGDQPVRLCDAPDAPVVWEWQGCPPSAPALGGIPAGDPGFFEVHVGPVLARVVDGGFQEVVLLGGGVMGGVLPGEGTASEAASPDRAPSSPPQD